MTADMGKTLTAAMRKLIIFKDDRGEWRWHVQSPNGDLLAEGGEGYKNESDCVDMAQSLLVKMRVEIRES